MAGVHGFLGIESGGAVEGLPVHTFPTDDGGVAMQCPTEIAISDRREAELAGNGFMPLVHKRTPISPPSSVRNRCNKPADMTTRMQLPTPIGGPAAVFVCNLPLCALPQVYRARQDWFVQRKDEMERWLTKWIMNYVDGDPGNSSEITKAKKPLAAAEVVLEEVEGNPGYYTSKFFLRPHYQLEGLTVSLSLVSKLPSAKGG